MINDQINEQGTLKRAKTKVIQWLETEIERRGFKNEPSENLVYEQHAAEVKPSVPKPTIKQTKINNERQGIPIDNSVLPSTGANIINKQLKWILCGKVIPLMIKY